MASPSERFCKFKKNINDAKISSKHEILRGSFEYNLIMSSISLIVIRNQLPVANCELICYSIPTNQFHTFVFQFGLFACKVGE